MGSPESAGRRFEAGDPAVPVRARFLTHLKEENFVLFYQAIVPVASPSGASDFREILVRYKEEEQGLLPPGSFLPILEDQGLMPLLDRWILFRLLRWGLESRRSTSIAPKACYGLHLSADTITQGEGFGDYVLEVLGKAAMPAASLSFEIAMPDALACRAQLTRLVGALAAAGCSFTLGGFRGEEPAFELAASLGITFAKLDGSLAATLSRDPAAPARVAAIVERCRELGMRTIGSRIEDTEALLLFRSLKVDYVQGFGIERPRPL